MKLIQKAFYGVLALLCDHRLAKSKDYESMDTAYRELKSSANTLKTLEHLEQ